MRQKEVEAKEETVYKTVISVNTIKDHTNVCFLFYITSLHCFVCFPILLLAASFQLRSLCSSHKFIALQIFYLNIWIFLKNHPQRRVFHNINLCKLENVLQRNPRTQRARESVLRASGGTNLKIFLLGPDLGLVYVLVSLKKLWIPHYYNKYTFITL